MEKKIEIVAGHEKAMAVMLENEAPKTCSAIWNLLPLASSATHAKISGEEIMLMVPLFIETENLTSNPEPGDICYWRGGQDICIYYGKVTSFLGAANRFARIVEGLESLKTVGRRNWFKQGEKVMIRKREE